MEQNVRFHARHGDKSLRSYFLCWKSEGGQVNFLCVIDKAKRFEAPNPTFCQWPAGGKSPDLLRFFQESIPKKEERSNVGILEICGDDSNTKVVFTLNRDGDCTIKTCDNQCLDGVTVTFSPDHHWYKSAAIILDLVLKCNTGAPEWNDPAKNAEKIFERDKLTLFP